MVCQTGKCCHGRTRNSNHHSSRTFFTELPRALDETRPCMYRVATAGGACEPPVRQCQYARSLLAGCSFKSVTGGFRDLHATFNRQPQACSLRHCTSRLAPNHSPSGSQPRSIPRHGAWPMSCRVRRNHFRGPHCIGTRILSLSTKWEHLFTSLRQVMKLLFPFAMVGCGEKRVN